MRDIMDLSIEDRVALCLAYAEQTLCYFEHEFNDGMYDLAFERFRSNISLGYDWLAGKKINWEVPYELCNDDERENGCFNFVAIYECSAEYETPSSVLIWTLYYFIYQCAHSTHEKYFPQDLWDGSLPMEEEKKVIDSLNTDVSSYLSAEACEILRGIEDKFFAKSEGVYDGIKGNDKR